MFFDELSNDEWALLSALVSDEPAVRLNRRGRPRADPRVVANAVLWILTTGEPWSKLPGRYPSGPTCRRRFEEWQLNGTLLEMVRLLSRTGRTFAYVPQPVLPVAAKPAATAVHTPSMRDDNPRGVSWKSPESWQAPGTSRHASNPLHAAGPHTGPWRSADPIGDITWQLAGFDHAAPASTYSVPTERAVDAVSRAPALPTPSVAYAPRPPLRADLRAMSEAGAVGAAMQGLNAAIESVRALPAAAVQRGPLPPGLAPRGRQVAERHGYLIYVAAERVPNAMYRAWAEIMKDGRRVERSGLVGPRFAEANAAEHYAFEWAAQWVDRECATLAAGEAAPQARSAQAYGAPMHVQIQRSAPMSNAAVARAPYPAPPARPMPGMRHLPDTVGAHYSAPLHGPLHASRGQVRRYICEPAGETTGLPAAERAAASAASAAASAATAVNAAANSATHSSATPAASTAAQAAAALASTECDKAGRYPSHNELLPHAG